MMPAPSPSTDNDLDSTTLHELSRFDKIIKTSVGLGCFLCWLLLFVFGMSLKSSDYRAHIFHDTSLDFRYLLLYAATFTPTNAAVLASLAGILGGFASNLAANNQFRHLRQTVIDSRSEDFESYLYMTENPLVSMLRGFITYLILVAGSYLTNFTSSANSETSFTDLTASSYFKFAVSVSLLAYLAGYDPSRMKGLINSISFTRKEVAAPAEGAILTHQTTRQTTDSIQVGPASIPPVLNGQATRPVS